MDMDMVWSNNMYRHIEGIGRRVEVGEREGPKEVHHVQGIDRGQREGCDQRIAYGGW